MSFAFLTTDAAASGSMLPRIFSLVLIVVVFYFFILRPQQKREKESSKMRSSLEVGDDIITIGGIVGKIVMVNPNTIVIETSDDRVRMELTKWAVSQVGVQTGEQPEAEKKEKKTEKKEETPAVEAPKADEDEKN